ncbi:MAG: hypothetical protein M3R11_08115 [Acidobacteriota bacterium]|jgi:hypothetical protein|nr:hypothetical protein [Acidobacteriota bacterium]
MLQNWTHKNSIPTGSPAPREMQFSVSLSVSLCADFDNPNYNAKLGGLDRTRDQI